MIDVARFDIRAVLQEKVRDVHSLGEMQWCLPITTSGVDDGGIVHHPVLEVIEHAKSRGAVSVHHGSALDETGSECRLTSVQDTESSGPPPASCIDVSTGGEEEVDYRQILPFYGGVYQDRVEGKRRNGLVESVVKLRVSVQDIARPVDIITFDGSCQ